MHWKGAGCRSLFHAEKVITKWIRLSINEIRFAREILRLPLTIVRLKARIFYVLQKGPSEKKKDLLSVTSELKKAQLMFDK